MCAGDETAGTTGNRRAFQMAPLASLDVNTPRSRSCEAGSVPVKILPRLAAEEEAAIKAVIESLHRAEPEAVQIPSVPSIGGGPITCSRELGTGGFGKVWLGDQLLTSASGATHRRRVAIKIERVGGENEEGVVTARDVARECSAHYQLFEGAQRPSSAIIQLYGSLLEPDRAILVLEHFDGVELQEYVTSQPIGEHLGWLHEAEARHYTIQILSGLAHAHSLGVAHLDVKPQNILISESDGKRVNAARTRRRAHAN